MKLNLTQKGVEPLETHQKVKMLIKRLERTTEIMLKQAEMRGRPNFLQSLEEQQQVQLMLKEEVYKILKLT